MKTQRSQYDVVVRDARGHQIYSTRVAAVNRARAREIAYDLYEAATLEMGFRVTPRRETEMDVERIASCVICSERPPMNGSTICRRCNNG